MRLNENTVVADWANQALKEIFPLKNRGIKKQSLRDLLICHHKLQTHSQPLINTEMPISAG